MAAATLNYRRPIEWPAQVEIELFVERLGNTSVSIGHRIIDAADTGVLYCDGHAMPMTSAGLTEGGVVQFLAFGPTSTFP